MAKIIAGHRAPSPKEIEQAWDIHKDADNLLHNRLNALLVVEALMFGAYFVAVDLAQAPPVRLYYQSVIFIAAIAVSYGYWRLSQRMIRGILLLKNEFLLPHMPVYAAYYRGLEKWRETKTAKPSVPKPPHYHLHQVTPWVFVVIWVLLFGMAVFSSITPPESLARPPLGPVPPPAAFQSTGRGTFLTSTKSAIPPSFRLPLDPSASSSATGLNWLR